MIHSAETQFANFCRRIAAPPLCFYFMIVAYGVANYFNAFRGLSYPVPLFGLDSSIPFLPYSLLLYLSFYAFFLLLWHFPAGSRAYNETSWALIGMTLVSVATFLVYPTSVDLRGQVHSGLAAGDYPLWLASAWGGLLALDPPYNAWPSIHISQPLLILLTVTQLRLFSSHVRACFWLYYLAVAVSVLTTKQHYVWDVMTGGLLALLVWFGWLKPRLERLEGKSL